ncbi:MAG: glycosyltransferase family 39 protein, partial [Phycisphaerae bacterium]|nr:glycosyltransferase family 39 protein [Phycisphaerae bacterium]
MSTPLPSTQDAASQSSSSSMLLPTSDSLGHGSSLNSSALLNSPALANDRGRRSENYFVCGLMCLVLLVGGAVAHLWYLMNNCPLDLAGDEALYWQYTNHLALSYYCKGPMIAYIIGAGRWLLADWSQQRVGSEMLAVRIPAIVLSVLTGIGIYVLALQTLRRPRLALASIALTFTMPVLAVGAVLMTIDTPLVFVWTWSLVCFHYAIRHDSNLAWIVGGLFVAIGILSKYTMLLIFPVVGLLLLMDPIAKRFLRCPGPYVAMLIGFAGFIPILLWNAQHDWVGFRHVAGQAGVSQSADGVDPLTGLAIYIGGQAGIIGPLWFVGMIWAAISLWRRPCDEPHESHDAMSVRLLVLATLVPFVAFLPFCVQTKIEPNWPVVAVISGTLLLALWLPRRLRLPTRAGRTGAKVFIAVGVLMGLGSTILMHHTEVLMPMFAKLAAKNADPWELAPASKYDPASRLRGWAQLGREVGEVLAAQRAAGLDPFIVADDYMVA